MNYLKLTQNYALFLENLNKDMSFGNYKIIFDSKVYFEDPLTKCHDLGTLYKNNTNIYKKLIEPRFLVKEIINNKKVSYLQWSFIYKKNKTSIIEDVSGFSRIEFNEKGKIVSNINYWDSTANIYKKIPILKNIILYIKNRIKDYLLFTKIG